MPSSNKTPELGLNQWGPGDKPKWADHNEDNAIVSAAVGDLSLLGTTDKTSLVAAANEIKNIRAALAPPRGRYDTYELLAAAHPAGEAGEAYLVGVGSQPELYIWDVDNADWIPAGNLQGVPGPNEITTATATPLSGVLVGKDGCVKEGVAGVDFVPPISGAAAGLAVFTATNGMQEAKSAADTRNALGAINGIWPESLGGSGMGAPATATATNLVGASVIDTNVVKVTKFGRFAVLQLVIHVATGATIPASSTPLLQLPEGYRPSDRVYIVAMTDAITPTEFGLSAGGTIDTPTILTAGKWYVGTAAFMIA